MKWIFLCILTSLFGSFPEEVDFRKIPLFEDALLYEESDSWGGRLAKTAHELGHIAFNDAPEIGAFLTLLKKRYELEAVVETGTFLGSTALFFSNTFDEVYTIEASEKHYSDAKERLKNHSNIQCCLGSSEKVLGEILPSLKGKRLLFYLDAHVYHVEAEKGGYSYWPLLDEIEAISKTHKDDCIIVIDDCMVPNTDIHGCLDKNGMNELSHELIREKLSQVFTGYTFHYLIPKNVQRAAKFVAIPKKWQKNASVDAGRVDVLPGLDFWNDIRTSLSRVKEAGYEIRIVNQFFNGKDQGDYSEAIAQDDDLKKIVVINNTVDPSYLSQFPQEKLVLFVFEPISLSDSYYAPCSRVYTWNDDLVDGVKFFKLYYPCMNPMLLNLPSFEEKKLCVMISGSDNAYPERRNELYSERMKMVEFFETKPAGEFDVYGRYWVKRHYRDYKGSIPGHHSGIEKRSLLKNYRFSICFENTKGLHGYVTEKIFDSFSAGCVPVYWGACNVKDYIPKGCFIDYRDFASKEELYQYLKNCPKDVYERYIDNIRTFLKSDQAKNFTPDHFEEIFYEAIL
jgi:hypothetical protein